MSGFHRCAVLAFLVALPCALRAQRPVPDSANVVYASVGGTNLQLDVYLPRNTPKPYPIVLWIHGGGWSAGSKDAPNGLFLLNQGFALVSINYRLSGEAIFPAQINDCKAAVRWVRANAATYGFDPARVGVFGSSAGGHLVALLGTSGGVSELEGTVGGNLEQSSMVQAVCDWYGPSNLETIGDYPSSLDHRSANSPESNLIGGALPENPDKARAASPITYVTHEDPPFLIQHGTDDMTVPFHQSVELDSALRLAGCDVTFIPIVKGTHGGGFGVDTVTRRVIEFFNRTLKAAASGVTVATHPESPGRITVVPHPATSASMIRFALAAPAETVVELFDNLGVRRAVRDLGNLTAGDHTLGFAELAGSASQPANGVYFCRVTSGVSVRTTPIVVVH